MRNVILGAMAAALLAMPITAEASPFSYIKRAGFKAAHGVADLAWAPIEVLINPVTHAIDFDRHNRISFTGWNLGLGVGLVKMNARAFRGMGDLLLFPFPSERHDRWHWEWSFQGFQRPLSEPLRMEDVY